MVTLINNTNLQEGSYFPWNKTVFSVCLYFKGIEKVE